MTPAYHYVTRTAAARVLDMIRDALEATHSPEDKLRRIKDALQCTGIPDLEPCPGSHQYDHCTTCAPRWGLVGPFFRVR
jgi:hypothetical protein